MAKISDIDAKLGEFDASYSSTVSVYVDDRLKNVKITKAILPLSIKALNIQNGEGIKVNYSYYNGDTRLGGWDNVDYISGVGQGDKIYLNFTDEFQNAINSKATKIVLQFVPDEIVEQYPFVEFEQNERLDVQYITLNTFQANGVSQKVDLGIAGEGKVDLSTGALSLITPIAKSTKDNRPQWHRHRECVQRQGRANQDLDLSQGRADQCLVQRKTFGRQRG